MTDLTVPALIDSKTELDQPNQLDQYDRFEKYNKNNLMIPQILSIKYLFKYIGN